MKNKLRRREIVVSDKKMRASQHRVGTYLVCAWVASATIESASMSLTGLASHSSRSLVLVGGH